jgi:type IV pilus biogenesis protein CpaD/CtpE
MTGIRGDRSRGARLLLVIAATTALLAGCATARPAPLGASPSESPTPTPTAACPQIEGVELPPECAPYDPDNAMAQNERYRDRVELSAESQAAAEAPAESVRVGLETLRTSGGLSIDAVEEVFADAGIAAVQTIGDERAVAFGAAAPEGGCIFGEVSADLLTVEIGGVIMDGGCLPAVGH